MFSFLLHFRTFSYILAQIGKGPESYLISRTFTSLPTLRSHTHGLVESDACNEQWVKILTANLLDSMSLCLRNRDSTKMSHSEDGTAKHDYHILSIRSVDHVRKSTPWMRPEKRNHIQVHPMTHTSPGSNCHALPQL